MKACPKCKSEKPLSEFYETKSGSGKYKSWCKSCYGILSRKNYARRHGVYDTEYTDAEWQSLCEKYDNKCLCCGEFVKLTPDHVVPLVCGGTNDISNIQPLCLSCNARKRDRIIDYRPVQ